MLRVRKIGSHFAGEPSNTVADLLKFLTEHPLDPVFEKYGNFCYKLDAADAARLDCIYHIHGNFYGWSYVFDITADTKQDAAELRRAIRRNQRTPAYKAARIEIREREAQRHAAAVATRAGA
jgi:hypothetical protein